MALPMANGVCYGADERRLNYTVNSVAGTFSIVYNLESLFRLVLDDEAIFR
jgi:hypothetical protein